MLRIAAPGEGDGDAGDIVEVDLFEAAAEGSADPFAVRLAGIDRNRHNRQVANRQDVRVGQVNGLARDLDRELRGADYGGADALARIDQRQVSAPAQVLRQRLRERLGDVA